MHNPIRTRDTLRDYVNGGCRVKYIFFWGHQPQHDDRVAQECLSQWYPSPFEVDGIHYATAEHYMMAEKARLFEDVNAVHQILQAGHPGEAKKLGRSVQGFEDARWKQTRFGIVVRGNVAKFSQHPDLAAYLQATGDRILVEASPRDAVWGIGLAADNPKASNPNLWKGLNLLGFALMEVRSALASA